MSKIEYRFLDKAEEYIARYEPNKSAEALFEEFERLMRVHREFEKYLKTNKIKITMPKKSDALLERRRLFINWYIERHKGKYLKEAIEELTLLTFASKTTISDTFYLYR